jgi:hypothetical protein
MIYQELNFKDKDDSKKNNYVHKAFTCQVYSKQVCTLFLVEGV